MVSPPPEVVEKGVQAIKEYMSEKMSGANEIFPKKRSWIGKLKKYGTFNGIRSTPEREGFLMPSYRTIDGFASSPRHISMFSPRRLFSPKRDFTR